MVESRRSFATRHSRIRGLLVMVAEVRKRVAQVRICGGVPTGVLCGHALHLSNERLQVVGAERGDITTVSPNHSAQAELDKTSNAGGYQEYARPVCSQRRSDDHAQG